MSTTMNTPDAIAMGAPAAPQDERAATAWMHPETLDTIHADRKREWATHFGQGGAKKAEGYTVPLFERAALPAQAAAPVDEPVAEVVMTIRPPNASPAWLPHKIVHASIAWLDSQPVGTKLYTRPAPVQAVAPSDPMDTPLPCDVKVGGVTMRKGVKLRTLVGRMERLQRAAVEQFRTSGYIPKDEAAPQAVEPAAPQAVPDAQPLFWYRPLPNGLYEGPVHANSVGGKMLRDEQPGEWFALFAAAQPAAQPDDAQDAARYRDLRDAGLRDDTEFLDRVSRETLKFVDPQKPTAAEWDAAIDAARTQGGAA